MTGTACAGFSTTAGGGAVILAGEDPLCSTTAGPNVR
jgi:hypothetical protein